MKEISIGYVYKPAQLEPNIKIIFSLSDTYFVMENERSLT